MDITLTSALLLILGWLIFLISYGVVGFLNRLQDALYDDGLHRLARPVGMLVSYIRFLTMVSAASLWLFAFLNQQANLFP